MSFNHEGTVLLEQAPAPATVVGIGEVSLTGALDVLAREHVTPNDLFGNHPCPVPPPAPLPKPATEIYGPATQPMPPTQPNPRPEPGSYTRYDVLIGKEEEKQEPQELPKRDPGFAEPAIPVRDKPDEHREPGKPVTPIRPNRGV